MARSTFLTSARRTISQCWVPPAACAPILAAPLRQQGELIGLLNARRTEVRPFTPAQIKLLETFADQAVIAIENVRLFKELKESLEQQTATSEILGVIASSPTDIQPVLEVIAESAARLCEATFAALHQVRWSCDYVRCSPRHDRVGGPRTRSRFHVPIDRDIAVGRAILDRRIVHIHDIRRDREYPGSGLGQMNVSHAYWPCRCCARVCRLA